IAQRFPDMRRAAEPAPRAGGGLRIGHSVLAQPFLAHGEVEPNLFVEGRQAQGRPEQRRGTKPRSSRRRHLRYGRYRWRRDTLQAMPVLSVADSVLRAIGGTPVVRLRRVVPQAAADV